MGILFLLTTLFLMLTMLMADERCSPKTLPKAMAICCGARPDGDMKPVLMSSETASGSIPIKKPSWCSTLSGTVILSPMPSQAFCCPGSHGRICCYLPQNASKEGIYETEHWSKDFITYVILVISFAVLMSTVTLLTHCCLVIIAKRRQTQRRGYQQLPNEQQSQNSVRRNYRSCTRV